MKEVLKEYIEFKRASLNLGESKFLELVAITNSRLNDIINGAEATVEELERISKVLQTNFSEMCKIYHNNDSYFFASTNIDNAIKNNDLDYLLDCFLNNLVIRHNNALYYANYEGKILREIPKDIVNQVFDYLMSNGFPYIINRYYFEGCGFNVSSLKDLAKYSDFVKKAFIFGSLYNIGGPCNYISIEVPNYFASLVNSFPKDDKKALLEEYYVWLRKYRNNIVHDIYNEVNINDSRPIIDFNGSTLKLGKYEITEIDGLEDILKNIVEVQKTIDDYFNTQF